MAITLLALLGVFLSAYMYLYKIGLIGTLACGSGSCETVQLSPYSKFLGIEVPLLGLLGYGALFVLGLASLQPRWASVAGPVRLVASASGIGVAFTVYLTWLELFVIHAICRWCVGSAVLIVLLFAVSVAELRAGARPRP